MTEAIARAVEQIKETVFLANLDESATKQSVVLRLLGLCGWDPFDPSQIVPEYMVGTRRVDFALRSGSANAVFIEVKRPRENLENHQQQLLEYCFQEGVKLAALTNGRTWWLYLPLQSGSWEHRRFLTIDLESQPSETVERWFMEYLSREKVISGRAVTAAESLALALAQSQQRAEVTSKTIVQAWNQIVETPDDLLVDLISETTERICGFKPERKLVEQFILRQVSAHDDEFEESRLPVHSRKTTAHSGGQSRKDGEGSTLPITLDPENAADFKAALLRAKQAWLEISYGDGRKEIRRWDASHMRPSSNVKGNLRSRAEFRAGTWQKNGIASLRVSIERPRNDNA